MLTNLAVTAMIFEVDASVSTPEDLRADPALADVADKQYVLEHAGPRTAVPSSVCYLPFSRVIPDEQLQEWAKTILSHSSKRSRLCDEIKVDRLTTDQNLGQIEYYFDTSNYNPYFASEPGKKYATMLMMLQYPFTKVSRSQKRFFKSYQFYGGLVLWKAILPPRFPFSPTHLKRVPPASFLS